jgi:CheY-like chemotaxis protein
LILKLDGEVLFGSRFDEPLMSNRALLLVEDDDDDVFIMKRALERAGVKNPLYIVPDGQRAMEYLGGTGRCSDRTIYPLPVLVFLDLKLP